MLRTARLVLRPLEEGDAAVLRELWSEREPRVPPHRRIDAEGRPTVSDLARRVQDAVGPPPGLLAVEVAETGEVVGYCGIVPTDDGEDPELAFELLRGHQGRGYATEAALAVVDAARAAGHERLVASVWDWNGPSLRVLDKVGFRETGRRAPDPERGTTILTALELGDR